MLLLNPAHCPHQAAAAAVAAVFMSDYDIALNWGNMVGSGLQISWSLAIEEKFYLLWPAILWRGRQAALLIIVGAIILCQIWKAWLIAHGAQSVRLCAAFDTHVDSIMWGCLAGLLLSSQRVRHFLRTKQSNALIPIALATALAILLPMLGQLAEVKSPSEESIIFLVGLPLFAAVVAALILSLTHQPKSIVAKVLTLPILIWIGRISYSLYLWHGVGINFVALHLEPSMHLSRFVSEALRLFVTLALAALSYYLVEKPFLKLKKRFEPRLSMHLPPPILPPHQ